VGERTTIGWQKPSLPKKATLTRQKRAEKVFKLCHNIFPQKEKKEATGKRRKRVQKGTETVSHQKPNDI